MVILFGFQSVSWGQVNAHEIVQMADKKRLGKTSISTIDMIVIRPNWSREVSMKVWTKGNEYLMILIIAPARDKGTTFLKRGYEIWNWIPRIDRNIKLPPSSMLQSWMGSDFTNDDLVKQSSIVDDYHHTLLGEENVNGRAVFKIEMIPKEDAAVVWGKILTWIDQQEMLFLKTEYYDEDNVLVNTMTGSDIKVMGGRNVTATMEMVPADDAQNKTRLTYQDLVFDESLEDDFFSLQTMKRIR
jgi:outer membrane lipoprotein-sorting protein